MKITAEMSIGEVVRKYPQTIETFINYGMGCFGCSAAQFENIEQGTQVHGIDTAALIADLNKVVEA
jgi:hybrid cluster-associated redox disulfide protein